MAGKTRQPLDRINSKGYTQFRLFSIALALDSIQRKRNARKETRNNGKKN